MFEQGQVIRAFSRRTGSQLFDAVIAKVCDTWIGLRPLPETYEGQPMNCNTDTFELFPINGPVFKFVIHEAK